MRFRDDWPAEYAQSMIDLCAGLLLIERLKQKGYVAGGPTIDRAQIKSLLEQGFERGVRPSKPMVELAMDALKSWNSTGRSVFEQMDAQASRAIN